MFVNLIDEEGRPVCPMVTCHKPVNSGEGQAHGIRPETVENMLANGFVAQMGDFVIVHKTCVSSEEGSN